MLASFAESVIQLLTAPVLAVIWVDDLESGRQPTSRRRLRFIPRGTLPRTRKVAMDELSNAVVGKAVSNGLDVKRIIFSDQERWDGRSLLIEGKPCQIIRTRYHVSNPSSPEAVSIRLYLPRTDWPDFLIYVLRQVAGPLEYYVLPRGVLSKETALCPGSLQKYRDAWTLFTQPLSPDLLERRFAVLNWQLRKAIAAAQQTGLEVTLIKRRTHRPWAEFCQTRILIEGRRCALHSLSRITPDSNDPRHDYVAVRKPKSDWAEFQLCMLPQSRDRDVYVIPSGSINASTVVSIENERLIFYRNNWNLLKEPVAMREIRWRIKALPNLITWKLRVPKPPKPIPAAILATIGVAEKNGLDVERPHLESQFQLLISGKRCQIVQTKSIVSTVASNIRTFVPLNLPRSDWAEFLIFFVRPDETSRSGDFYIVPRAKLTKRTVVSPTYSWLRDYTAAWHLLG